MLLEKRLCKIIIGIGVYPSYHSWLCLNPFSADSISDPFFPRTTQILLEYQLGRWVPRLRKPRDLYGVSSSGPLSPTRWPYHCEVIDEKIEHIGMFLASFGDSNIGRLTVPNLTSVKTLLVLNSMFQQKYNTNHVYNF